MSALLDWAGTNATALTATPIGTLAGVLLGRRGRLPNPLHDALTERVARPFKRSNTREAAARAHETRRYRIINDAADLAYLTRRAYQVADFDGCRYCNEGKQSDQEEAELETALVLLSNLQAKLFELAQYEASVTLSPQPTQDDLKTLHETLVVLRRPR